MSKLERYKDTADFMEKQRIRCEKNMVAAERRGDSRAMTDLIINHKFYQTAVEAIRTCIDNERLWRT